MSIIDTLVTRDFLISALAAASVGAVIFTLGASLFDKNELKDRMNKVALEREKMRQKEIARLTQEKNSQRGIRSESKGYMQDVVDKFSLRDAFMDEGTVDMLAQGGYRGQGAMTTYMFLRFVTPFLMFALSFAYMSLSVFSDRPLYLVAMYALFAGLASSYLPTLMLKNKIVKRQQSIRRAWPDCLDLMLLCVDSGMSIEHAFKRVGDEIGMSSIPLAEEIKMTNAELSFLEERARAFENLGKRTGLDAVRAVMTALIQADRYGTSISQTLRVMADESREARMMDAEKKAASLPPKLTVPLILFFLPVLFIVIMGPAMISIFGKGGIAN